MSTLHIDLPAHFGFATEIPVYIQHINYGRHLDNAALLMLASEARVRFLQSMGYREDDVEGCGIIVANAAVQYRSQAFYGEVLLFEMAAQAFGARSCDLVYRVSEKNTRREVAHGKTGIVFFDYATQKPAAIPAAFRSRTEK